MPNSIVDISKNSFDRFISFLKVSTFFQIIRWICRVFLSSFVKRQTYKLILHTIHIRFFSLSLSQPFNIKFQMYAIKMGQNYWVFQIIPHPRLVV